MEPSELIFGVSAVPDFDGYTFIFVAPREHFEVCEDLWDNEIECEALNGILVSESEAMYSPCPGVSIEQARERLLAAGLTEESRLGVIGTSYD